MINLQVKIGKLEIKTPVILASGTCGPFMKGFARIDKLGAMITKTITYEPKEGNPPPRTVETVGGMINSIGLDNPGIHNFIDENLPDWLNLGIPIILSVGGNSIDEYIKVIKDADNTGIVGYELNVSCPNVKGDEFGKSANNLYNLCREVKKITKKTIIIKLSPNVSNIQELAKACEDGGADGISLINTLYALAIDVNKGTALLGGITGGLSGPCIKPVALYYVYKASQVVNIPIIGIGGITNYLDAIEFLITGATAIEVGTYNFIDPDIGAKIVDGIVSYCEKKKIDNIYQIIKSRKF